MIDALDGYKIREDNRNCYLHHMVTILKFGVLQLLDRTLAGRPLTIAEWRDALWGDYTLDSADRCPRSCFCIQEPFRSSYYSPSSRILVFVHTQYP